MSLYPCSNLAPRNIVPEPELQSPPQMNLLWCCCSAESLGWKRKKKKKSEKNWSINSFCKQKAEGQECNSSCSGSTLARARGDGPVPGPVVKRQHPLPRCWNAVASSFTPQPATKRHNKANFCLAMLCSRSVRSLPELKPYPRLSHEKCSGFLETPSLSGVALSFLQFHWGMAMSSSVNAFQTNTAGD